MSAPTRPAAPRGAVEVLLPASAPFGPLRRILGADAAVLRPIPVGAEPGHVVAVVVTRGQARRLARGGAPVLATRNPS